MSKRYKNNAIALAVANYKQAVSEAFDTCPRCGDEADGAYGLCSMCT